MAHYVLRVHACVALRWPRRPCDVVVEGWRATEREEDEASCASAAASRASAEFSRAPFVFFLFSLVPPPKPCFGPSSGPARWGDPQGEAR